MPGSSGDHGRNVDLLQYRTQGNRELGNRVAEIAASSQRQARARQRTLHYVDPPEALRALARLSDVEPLITGQATGRPLKTGS